VEDNDKALVRRVLTGDRQAYRGIVEKNKARIYFLGVKFFHSPENAEDFTQEVFLKAYEKLGTYRGMSPFSAWLYRLAFNLAVNQYHVAKRRLVAAEPAEIPDESASPEGQLIRKEKTGEINNFLKELPDVYNIVIRMHYYDGLAYKDISKAMGIPVNTVKSHVHRAKKLLLKKMERHG
jgi:RNA polymerase sigma-70 factor (ECF subfamily)